MTHHQLRMVGRGAWCTCGSPWTFDHCPVDQAEQQRNALPDEECANCGATVREHTERNGRLYCPPREREYVD